MEKKQFFQQFVLEQLDIHMQRKEKESRQNFHAFTKINSKWITDLNVKCKTIKLLEDDIGENLDDLGYGDDFLNTAAKTQSMKEIVGKLDFGKTKNFYSAKDTV